MKRFDVKSALAGLACGVMLMLCLGAATGNLHAPVSRFQGFASEGHAFIVDTTTGQVWHGYSHPGNSSPPQKSFLLPKLATQ